MEKLAAIYPFIAMVGGIYIIGICIFFFAGKRSIKKSPILSRYGKIIEKIPGTYERLIVEFENGQRERLVDLKHSALYTVGDEGLFKTQKHTILSFERH